MALNSLLTIIVTVTRFRLSWQRFGGTIVAGIDLKGMW